MARTRSVLEDDVTAEIQGQGPWPAHVKLIQPFQLEQILLADSAACLATHTFLNMCGLPFIKEERANAEDMSPTGQVPLLKAGPFVVAEFEKIVAFAGYKKASLTSDLTAVQKADMRAYMSLVTNVLGTAERYISWQHADTYTRVTLPRYGSAQPWPLSVVLATVRRRRECARLRELGWADKTLGQVYKEVERCFLALSQRLGQQPYFFGEKATELDALVFGHLFTLITTTLRDSRLSDLGRNHRNLVELLRRVERDFFLLSRVPVDSAGKSPQRQAPREDTIVPPAEVVSQQTAEAMSQQDVESPLEYNPMDTGYVDRRPPLESHFTRHISSTSYDPPHVSSTSSSEKSGSNGEYDKLDEISQC